MGRTRDDRTQPEIPSTKARSPDADRSAVYRRVRVRARDPLADLVEEVVRRPNDPRCES